MTWGEEDKTGSDVNAPYIRLQRVITELTNSANIPDIWILLNKINIYLICSEFSEDSSEYLVALLVSVAGGIYVPDKNITY